MNRFAHLFVSHGEATEIALSHGERITGRILMDDLRYVSEQPVPKSEVEALHNFLKTAPSSNDRRRVKDRQEGMRLLEVIDSHNGGSLSPAALDALRAYLRGDSAKAHRPRQRPGSSNRARFDNMAAGLVEIIYDALSKDEKPKLPHIGEISEPDKNKTEPLGERVLLLTHQILHDLGFNPPSVARLKNRVSERNAKLRDFSVKARSEKSG